jgi:nitroreductase
MDVIAAIEGRYTHRGTFNDKEVDKATMLQLIRMAGWAPSGHNSQPWEFLVIDDNKIIIELITEAADIFLDFQKTRPDFKQWVHQWRQFLRWSDAELEAAGDGMYLPQTPRALWEELFKADEPWKLQAGAIETLYPKEKLLYFTKTPCLIYTLLDKSRKLPNPSYEIMELASIGAAIQNLRLAAHSLGLATHEFSLLYDLPQTNKIMLQRLGIPSHFSIVSVMRIGYPAEQSPGHRTRVRKPAEKLVHWNHY